MLKYAVGDAVVVPQDVYCHQKAYHNGLQFHHVKHLPICSYMIQHAVNLLQDLAIVSRTPSMLWCATHQLSRQKVCWKTTFLTCKLPSVLFLAEWLFLVRYLGSFLMFALAHEKAVKKILFCCVRALRGPFGECNSLRHDAQMHDASGSCTKFSTFSSCWWKVCLLPSALH